MSGRTLILRLAVIGALASAVAETSFPGVTEPIQDESFSATVAGRIATVHVKPGDLIEADAVLVSLDDKMERLEVERRQLVLADKTKLAAAKARAASKQDALEVARRKLIWETTDELAAAKKRLETVRLDYEGTAELFKTTQSVSRDAVMLKELEVRVAEAEVAELESREKREKLEFEIASDNLALAGLLNKAQVDALEVEESREKIEYEAAVEQLARRQVRSSIAGRVRRVLLREGESCTAGQALVQVVDSRRVRFIANVDATVAEAMAPGQAVSLRFDLAAGPLTRAGTLTYLSPVVDAASGLREVWAVFDNGDEAMTPGIAGTIVFGKGQ